MGKKDKKKSSSSSSTSKPPSCSCTDPYKCSCGNRPERPSRGHKWDATTQTWTGKGHKQRGSGAAHASTQTAVVTKVGQTRVEPWQRLPSVLLREACRREKRPDPKFTKLNNHTNNNNNNNSNNNNNNSTGRYKFRVILPDPKKVRDRDLIFRPQHGCDNEEQAKEEAALLALLHVTPSLPHERKLPEPYKTTWIHAVAAMNSNDNGAGKKGENGGGGKAAMQKKQSSVSDKSQPSKTSSTENNDTSSTKQQPPSSTKTTSSSTTSSPSNTTTSTTPAATASTSLTMDRSYTSYADKRAQQTQKQTLRNTKLRKRQAQESANRDAAVFMAPWMRKQIEQLLRRSSSAASAAAGSSGETEDESEEEEDELYQDLKTYLDQKLHTDHFTIPQIHSCLSHPSIKTKLLQSIQLYQDDEYQLFSNSYEYCIQWLCVHLNEEDLPEGFDPRGRTLDVVVGKVPGSSKNKAEEEEDDGGYKEEVLEFARWYGLTNKESNTILTHVEKQPPAQQEAEPNAADKKREALFARARRILWNSMSAEVGFPPIKDDEENDGTTVKSPTEEQQELLDNEMEALQAIFAPHECVITSEFGMTKICISLNPTMGEFDDNDNNDNNEKKEAPRLEVYITPHTYPQTPPMVFLSCSTTSTFANNTCRKGVALHLPLAKCAWEAAQRGEDGMVYELYGVALEMVQDEDGGGGLGGLKEQRVHLDWLNGNENKNNEGNGAKEEKDHNKASKSKEESAASKSKKNSKSSSSNSTSFSRRRRPRERSLFWTQMPQDAHPAIAFPRLPLAMERARKGLPAAKARGEFLKLMAQADAGGRVILVTGETGCGKTTQIPQFILEEAPTNAKIVVAQPRRLAATGVAARVANERGEETPGKPRGSVGYVVRGDSAVCDATRLLFCTTGVLLRQLQAEAALDCITHIVVDEVHERHLDTDVLLGLLKETLPLKPNLRVVLMSATMDADRFAAFWGPNTPRMHIPGFTHPVEDFTLEHVLKVTGYRPPKKLGKKKKQRRGRDNYQGSRKGDSWEIDTQKVGSKDMDDDEDDEGGDTVTTEDMSASLSERGDEEQAIIDAILKRMDESCLDFDMIAFLVRHLLRKRRSDDDGSILVFLPGAPEISKAEDTIKRILGGGKVGGVSVRVLPLHGGLQPRDQNLVFQKTPRGVAKVILATNVAETSITIPDCTVVIDTCKEKQSSFDPINRMPLLVERFASQDSLKQRRGRAGRVRPGTCYKLISKKTFEKLPEHGEPEIRRCALDQTLLSLLFLGVEKGNGNFLRTLLDPPSQESIDAAIFSLNKMGAVEIGGSEGERRLALTPLGMHLAGIPAPPTVGKLLVMGSLMGCRSPALAIAAGMSVGRSPFLKIDVFQSNRDSDPRKEAEQTAITAERAKVFKSVGNSDHAMLAAVYAKWEETGGLSRKNYLDSLGLSFSGMRDMQQLVRQLDGALSSIGFADTEHADVNATSWRIVRACVVSALSPAQIVRVERPSAKYSETAEGAVEKDGVAKELKFFIRAENEGILGDNYMEKEKNTQTKRSTITRYHGVQEERVFIHPSSMNFSVGNYSCPWLVYHEMVRTSKPFLRDATECSSYGLLLFGGTLEIQALNELIVVDQFIRLSAAPRIGALIGGLRQRVDDMLTEKVSNPRLDIVGSDEMQIIVKLLMGDGLGQ